VAAAAVVRGAFGFGDALVAMPLLVALLGARTATPLVAILMAAAGLMVFAEARRAVDWRGAARLLAGAVPGALLGAVALRAVPEHWLALALGVGLVLFGLHGLLSRAATDRPPRSPHWAWPLGFFSGALGGALNTAGPPLVVFATMQRWSPARTRGTLQGVFLPLSAVVLSGHALGGMWTREVWMLVAASAPALLIGTLLGGALGRRISAGRFQRLLYGLLVVLGGLLLVP
jgi:uncharacterized protein